MAYSRTVLCSAMRVLDILGPVLENTKKNRKSEKWVRPNFESYAEPMFSIFDLGQNFFIEIRYENFTIWTPGFRSGHDQYIVFCTTMSLHAHNAFRRFLSTNTSRLLVGCTYRERGRSQLYIGCLITNHGENSWTR